jgi:hypothetical protein
LERRTKDRSYRSRFLYSVGADARMEIVKCFVGIHVVALLCTTSHYDLGSVPNRQSETDPTNYPGHYKVVSEKKGSREIKRKREEGK